jgi:hypothetical protein
MVCERLDGGRLTAIDWSPTMVEAAARRKPRSSSRGRQSSWWLSSRTGSRRPSLRLDLRRSGGALPPRARASTRFGRAVARLWREGARLLRSAKTAPFTNAFAALRIGRRTSPCRAPGRYTLRGHARRGPLPPPQRAAREPALAKKGRDRHRGAAAMGNRSRERLSCHQARHDCFVVFPIAFRWCDRSCPIAVADRCASAAPAPRPFRSSGAGLAKTPLTTPKAAVINAQCSPHGLEPDAALPHDGISAASGRNAGQRVSRA